MIKLSNEMLIRTKVAVRFVLVMIKMALILRNQDSYRLDGRGSIPHRVKRLFSTPQHPDRLRPNQSPIKLSKGCGA
jgi:hypothetical protein